MSKHQYAAVVCTDDIRFSDQAKKKAAAEARVGGNVPLQMDWFSTPPPEANPEDMVNNEVSPKT